MLHTLTALDVLTVDTPDVTTGRSTAARILQSLGVSNEAAMSALKHLSGGAGPEERTMRGAIIMDAQNGNRLEPDQERGVRASRFDWTNEALDELTVKLKAIGLMHYRTREALALATKVAHAPGIVAELCWSDDPEYTAGYVASRGIGYVRFPMLKSQGNPNGGRVFFVNHKNLDMTTLIHYLQNEAVLITESGKCLPAISPDDYFTT
jgi:6-carboxyhexanoate--CoA ligase